MGRRRTRNKQVKDLPKEPRQDSEKEGIAHVHREDTAEYGTRDPAFDLIPGTEAGLADLHIAHPNMPSTMSDGQPPSDSPNRATAINQNDDGWQTVAKKAPRVPRYPATTATPRSQAQDLADNHAAQALARVQLEAAQVTTHPIVLADPHGFHPPLSFCRPQRRDPILQKAKRIIAKVTYRTFDGYMNPLQIEPLFSVDVRSNQYGFAKVSLTVAMYAIGRVGLMAKVPLMLTAPPKGPAQVVVGMGDGCVPLGPWLQTLPASTVSVTGKAGYQAQFKWYAASDQKIPIMDLPDKLWVPILRYTFGYEVFPDFERMYGMGTSDPRATSRREQYDPTMRVVDAPTVGILTLNKQIHAELRDFVRKTTTKCFNEGSKYFDYTYALPKSAPFRSEHLHKLELNLSHLEYMHLFLVDLPPFNMWGAFSNTNYHRLRGRAPTLASLPSLKVLTLRFRAPIFGATDEPWARMGDHNGYEKYYDFRGNHERDGFHTSCQKELVDWILTFAFDFIKDIPRIVLGGYLKNSTKAKWEAIFADRRTGIMHNMDQVKNQIASTNPHELGPRCRCSKPCAFAAMYTIVHRDDLHPPEFRPRAPRMCGKKRREYIDQYEFDFKD